MGHNFDYCGEPGCRTCGMPPCPTCAAMTNRLKLCELVLNDVDQMITDNTKIPISPLPQRICELINTLKELSALLADKRRLSDTVAAQVAEMTALRRRHKVRDGLLVARLEAADKVAVPARKLEESLRRCDRDGVPIVNAMALMDLRAALAKYEKEG